MAELLTTAQVAERLGVTPQGVARMVKRAALIPAHKGAGPRGAYLFDAEHVDDVAEDRAR